jgi:hypothetical protein
MTLVADKGIVPMNAHRSMTHATMRARAIPGKHAAVAQSAQLPTLPAQRIVVMALLVAAAAMGSLAAAGPANAHVSTHDTPSASRIVNVPWMY